MSSLTPHNLIRPRRVTRTIDTILRWSHLNWFAWVAIGIVIVFAIAFNPARVLASDIPVPGEPWSVMRLPADLPLQTAAKARLSDDEAMSLAELSDLALRNNPATQAAWANASADLGNVALARSTLRPNVTMAVHCLPIAALWPVMVPEPALPLHLLSRARSRLG